MNLSEVYIRRPVMTTLVMASLLIFGIQAYLQLPVSDLPNVDFPTIQVFADLPGASPQTMASAVATPLERQFSTIAGIDTMTSSSVQGSTQITIQFVLTRDIDAAAQDVQAAIARAARQLPAELPTPPYYRKVNPADQPILYLALTTSALPLWQLNEYGDTVMAQRISMVDGVAQVLVFGSQKYAVRIQLDPQSLYARGLGIDEVAEAVMNANVNLPTGVLQGSQKAFTVQATGQLMRAAAFRPTIVRVSDEGPIRLEDLGDVIDSVEEDKIAAWYCTPERQQRAIMLAVQRQPGTNTIAVADAVKALVPTFRAQLPPTVALNVLFDRSTSIKESADDVQFTLLLTLALVVLVIFLFLRNLTATAIPSLALPMSIVGTFVVMYLLSYSLDNLSLMALTLAVGFVVDDAIVMLENIVRHLEMGKSRLQAALDGSKEIGFTIISMTLSLAAVFIPVLFMGGLVGRLFREFAVTIGASVLVSGAISLTLTPMLAALLLRQRRGGAERQGSDEAHAPRGWMVRFYGWSLRAAIHNKVLMIVVSLAILAATVWLFMAVPKGFLPSEDRGMVSIQAEAAEGISFKSLAKLQQAAASVVQKDPNVEAFMSSAGARPGTPANAGRMFLRLKPRAERALSADQVIQELRPKLALPGLRCYLQNPLTVTVGPPTKGMYQYTLQCPDTDELYRSAARLIAQVRELPGLQDISTDMLLKNPELNLAIDRDKASTLGVSATRVETALYTAYSSRQVSTIYAPDNQYQVIMELLPECQADPASLDLLHVRSTRGGLVPLSSVTTAKEEIGPLTINHWGQLPAVTISFNLRPGVSLGQAVEQVDAIARATLPPGVSTRFQGAAQVFQSSLKGLGMLLAMAILVIYVVLGILYESFIHPLTILTALPFAGFGALVTLVFFDTDLSIYAFVGIIMLVGIVKKNGIMMVDFAIEAQRQGMTAEEAIVQACLVRFRPIMMTTMAALMAGIPIAVGYGAGAESRQPLGLAVVGGLIFSQTLTLYVTPIFYLYMDRLRAALSRSGRPVAPGH